MPSQQAPSDRPNEADPFTIHHPPFTILEAALGYHFRNPALLDEALTHKSYLHNNPSVTHGSNERLEFLGDAILGYLAAVRLYHDYPEQGEGKLSQLRAALVRRENLAAWAEEIGLENYLHLGRGVANNMGRNKQRILANAFEAIIGAIFLDRDINAVSKLLQLRLKAVDEALARQPNYKGQLMEMVQAQLALTPLYHTVEDTDTHQFTAEVLLPGHEALIGSGQGRNKQLAEQAAAQDALAKLQSAPEQSNS